MREKPNSTAAASEHLRAAIRIGVETGEDEAFLIGTRAVFLKLASALVEAAENCGRPGEVNGVTVQWSTKTAGIVTSELAFSAECLCNSEEEAERVYAHFASGNAKDT